MNLLFYGILLTQKLYHNKITKAKKSSSNNLQCEADRGTNYNKKRKVLKVIRNRVESDWYPFDPSNNESNHE